jgi:hypothetical protein
MGMLTPNLVIGVLHGTVGDLIFVPMKNGKICIKHRPVRDFRRAIPGQLRLFGGEADQRLRTCGLASGVCNLPTKT